MDHIFTTPCKTPIENVNSSIKVPQLLSLKGKKFDVFCWLAPKSFLFLLYFFLLYSLLFSNCICHWKPSTTIWVIEEEKQTRTVPILTLVQKVKLEQQKLSSKFERQKTCVKTYCYSNSLWLLKILSQVELLYLKIGT